jgi:diphthine-ammonia ligase
MKAAALFSGGKDSIYAIYLAEKQGYKVDHLICLIPSLPWPSPHATNVQCLTVLADSMKKHLVIIDYKQNEEGLVQELKRLKVDALIAGDIAVEQHITHLKKVCSSAGVNLLEPLFGMNSHVLLQEMLSLGFKAIIVGVDVQRVDEKWLGFILSAKTAKLFLDQNKNIDPLDENGEYHTIVTECPLYSKPFKPSISKRISGEKLRYAIISLT